MFVSSLSPVSPMCLSILAQISYTPAALPSLSFLMDASTPDFRKEGPLTHLNDEGSSTRSRSEYKSLMCPC